MLPFVGKILQTAVSSPVFKPPNPWTMSLLELCKAIHSNDGLKLNIKFEVEVMFRNLNIQMESVQPASKLLAKIVVEFEDGNEDWQKQVQERELKKKRASAAAAAATPEVQSVTEPQMPDTAVPAAPPAPPVAPVPPPPPQ